MSQYCKKIEVKEKRKFFELSVSWKTILYYVSPFLLIAIFFVLVPMMFGWHPTLGASMKPTLPTIGGYFKFDEDVEPKIGSLAYIEAPNDGKPCIKRVEKISSDGSLWVSADNKGWTGEDSDNYGWVNSGKVKGVVTNIFSVKDSLTNLRKSPKNELISDLRLRFPNINSENNEGFIIAYNSELIEIYYENNLLCQSSELEFTKEFWQGLPILFTDDSHEKIVSITTKGELISPDKETENRLQETPFVGRKTENGILAYEKIKATVKVGDSGHRNVYLYGLFSSLSKPENKIKIKIDNKFYEGVWINQEINDENKTFCLVCLDKSSSSSLESGKYIVDVYIKSQL